MKLKTVLTIAAAALITWWIIHQPDAAQHLVNNIGAFLTRSAIGLVRFLSSI